MDNNIYNRLGVRPLINASGTLTSLGGSRLRECAAQAMAEAGACFVDLEELHRKAGERIAGLLGVDSACVTVSASAGLVQAAAACLAGTDPVLQARLPTPPERSKIILQCSHRNPFDRCLRVAGADLEIVGDAIQTYPYDLEGAIDNRTAAVAFFLQAAMLDASLSLEETIAIAHRHSVPVIVDAAAELPPKCNLWEIAGQGADLVIFSGGKDIGGPQSSGLIIGRRDLVEAAFLQSAPYELVVARSMKAGKETVAGLLAALEEYMQDDEAARFEQWERIAEFLLAGLNKIPGLAAERWQPGQPKTQPAGVPRLAVRLQPELSLSLPGLVEELRRGVPPIAAERSSSHFFVNTHTLCFEEAGLILKRLAEILENSERRETR